MKSKYRVINKKVMGMIHDAVVSARDGGKEICGLLVYNGFYLDLIKTRNKIKKGGGFSYYFSEVRSIEEAAKILSCEVVGTFHSHPMYIAEPGESDLKFSENNSLMLIIDVMDKTFALWHIKDGRKKKIKVKLISK